MFIYKKYNCNYLVNYNFLINTTNNNYYKKTNIKTKKTLLLLVNYTKTMIKNFIYLYSFFYLISPFSNFVFKNKIKYNFFLNTKAILFFDYYYNLFLFLDCY